MCISSDYLDCMYEAVDAHQQSIATNSFGMCSENLFECGESVANMTNITNNISNAANLVTYFELLINKLKYCE